jgi:hypothetical protein
VCRRSGFNTRERSENTVVCATRKTIPKTPVAGIRIGRCFKRIASEEINATKHKPANENHFDVFRPSGYANKGRSTRGCHAEFSTRGREVYLDGGLENRYVVAVMSG